MQNPRFMQRTETPLQSLYEHNYWLFRLVLPQPPEDERLAEIFDGLTEIIAETKPEVMSIEKLFFARNVTTAISVAHARGVAMLTGRKAGLAIAEYTPLQIKQTLTGYGKADKKQIQEMVRLNLGLSQVPKPDDCADALAAAITHAAMTRPSVV